MRFTRAGRVSLAAAGSLAVALLAAACSGSSAGTTSTTAVHLEKTSIVVDALPVVDAAGLYLAIKNGYFRQAGLTVTAKPVVASTLAIPGMEAGTVDLVDANYSSYFLEEVSDPQKYQFKVVVDGNSCDTSTDDVLALPSSGIRSPAQLANKTIAVNVANNIQTLMINASLAANGVNPATVHYKVVPFPLMAAELKAHRVDAIGVVEPFIISAELGIGANPILSECAGPTANFPISGYLATKPGPRSTRTRPARSRRRWSGGRPWRTRAGPPSRRSSRPTSRD